MERTLITETRPAALSPDYARVGDATTSTASATPAAVGGAFAGADEKSAFAAKAASTTANRGISPKSGAKTRENSPSPPRTRTLLKTSRRAVTDDVSFRDILLHLGFDEGALRVFSELGFDVDVELCRAPFYVLENL